MELYGIISAIDYRTKKITIYNAITETRTPIVLDINLIKLLYKGDTIYLEYDVKNKKVIGQPVAIFATNKTALITYFNQILEHKYYEVDLIYKYVHDSICRQKDINDEEEICKFLNSEAETFHKYGNHSLSSDYKLSPCYDLILNWWYKKRNIRRLKLLGLTYNEISSTDLNTEDLYNTCLDNPYKIPSLPIEKCDFIYDILGKQCTDEIILYAQLIRKLRDLLHQRSWVYIPYNICVKIIPEISKYKTQLIEYGMYEEKNLIYLKQNYDTEKIVAKYIKEFIEKDKENMTCRLMGEKKLSEDQNNAIEGALNNRISIITGGAGCGKCLAKGTQIIKYDGTLISVENIIVGDTLITPHSEAIKVISICNGIDNLYEIITEYGDRFTCNEPHILTLYVDEKIIDISVEDFLKLDKKSQEQHRLIHCRLRFFDDYTCEKREQLLKNSTPENMKYLAATLGYIIDKNGNIRKDGYVKFTVRYVGVGEYYGFTLDNDEGRFVLGNGIITHNTTCIEQIVYNLRENDMTYQLCSFTGKAVARIREVTKTQAQTIHRLINDKIKIGFDCLIIDEASMVTTELFHKLISIYSNIKKIILIGDINQLPPVSWGNLFGQLISSKTVPTFYLKTNHRVYTLSGQEDGIICNSNALITHNPMYPFEFVEKENNFVVLNGGDDVLRKAVTFYREKGINQNQMIVITPYNDNIRSLNIMIQEIYNDNKKYEGKNRKWIVGDKVMLTKNNKDIGLFNGESGIIENVIGGFIKVNFGNGTVVEISVDDNIEHAYALTIDKSQGSEWDHVIIYIPKFTRGKFLNKNRLYTAVTRAKRSCCIISPDIEQLHINCIKSPPYRFDTLSKRLTEILPVIVKKTPEIIGDHECFDDIPEDYYDFGDDYDYDD